ncbi:hypothetical protein FJZ41_03855, partial [Candidatus Shapirobacteria bacterium]|nr:hypothetical protein [Candidatus Shapirobacteria bacterium]
MVVKTVKVSQKSRRGFWFFIILIVVFSFIGFKTYRWVKQSLWDGQNRFNLVVNPSGDAAVLIVSFNPTEKKVNALVIPTGTFIETIHGYGPYRIEAIYNLGELNGQGGQLLSGSLQYYLGLPIDGFIAQQNSFLKNGREGLHLFVLDQFYGALKGKGKTNLSRWDLLRLWWFFRNVRSDKVNLVDLGQTSASELIDLPDGTQAR